jgi:two-component system OmpR family sensor kinase
VRFGSLRTRVTSWYVGFLAVTLILFGSLLYFGLARYLELSIHTSLQDQANSLAQRLLPDLAQKGTEWFVGEVGESYAPEISGRFIRITRQDGAVLYRSGNTRDPDISAASVPQVSPEQRTPKFRIVKIQSHSIVVYSLPFVANGTAYLVETGASHDTIARLLRGLLGALLLLTPATLVAAAIGGRLLMSQPLKPLVTLTDQAERIDAGSVGDRLPVIPSGDELERLSLSLNRMITRLEDALAHNRRFSADVSHELRTPLTILRGEIEQLVAQSSVSAMTANALGSALEEIDRMSKIVESLLAISRIDAGGELTRTPVDLGHLATRTTEQLCLLADEKQITLECTAGRRVIVPGDSIRLSQVIVNLVDNAMKYSETGGHVSVTVEATDSHGVLTVEDNGAGIPQHCLPHVFERFYRADEARSRQSGGAGLGLSIVKAICTAHAAEILLESIEGRGTRVRVELPLAKTLASRADPTVSHSAAAMITFDRKCGDWRD